MIGRITPNHIIDLHPSEIFVFGSNLAGIHGAGAAKTALRWGAIRGQGVGPQGQTYAIPTKDAFIKRTLPISQIKGYVDDFIKYAEVNSDHYFLVTEIGCGLAGYSVADIAPLFYTAAPLFNVKLPMRFWEFYGYNSTGINLT